MSYISEIDAKWEQGLALDRLREAERIRKFKARSKARKGKRKAGRTGSVLLVCQGFYR